MKKFLNQIGGSAIIIVVAFFGLKGCYVELYSADEIEVYSTIDNIEETFYNYNTVYLMPKNKMVFLKEGGDLINEEIFVMEDYDYGVYKINGEAMTNYFGPLYNTGNTLLGIRLLFDVNEAFKLNMELVHTDGNLDYSSFGEIGERYKANLFKRDSTIDLRGVSYNRRYPEQGEIDKVIGLLEFNQTE